MNLFVTLYFDDSSVLAMAYLHHNRSMHYTFFTELFALYLFIALILLQVYLIYPMTIRLAFYQLACSRSYQLACTRSLRGGCARGNISKLVGRAGAGNSQFALQLCIMAARYDQASIYMDTKQKTQYCSTPRKGLSSRNQ